MSDGTSETVVETTPDDVAEETLDLEGFAEAMTAGFPPTDDESQPEPAEAVETSEVEETPPAPEEETKVESEEPEGEPDTEPTVNFDGFSDGQKATFERLLKDGHVTPEEIEESRKNSLFQSAFTKKTMALAEKRKAFETEMVETKDDLELLNRIRSDPRLHAAWLKMSSGDVETVDEAGDDLVDRKTAERLADERIKAREAEQAERTAKEQRVYDAKKEAISEALQEIIPTLAGITNEQLVAYLKAEEGTLQPGVDPILHFTPEELQYRVSMRHSLALAEAKAEAAEARLSKKTSKDARTAKQSLPPARRVATGGDLSPLQQTEADLNLAPDWSNVQGMGWGQQGQ